MLFTLLKLFWFICLCCLTYLHTPWCPRAGQSPRGTCQSSALCVGKNLTCTWCRSLCWSRTRSSLSCTLEEKKGRKRRVVRVWATLSSGVDRKLRGLGKGVLERIILSLPQKKPSMPCESFLSRAQVYFRELVLPDSFFSFIFLFLFREGESTVWKRNSGDGEKLCHADPFQQLHQSGNRHTRSHVFN